MHSLYSTTMTERQWKRTGPANEFAYKTGGIISIGCGLNVLRSLSQGQMGEAMVWAGLAGGSLIMNRIAAHRRGIPPEIETLGKILMRIGSIEATNRAIQTTSAFTRNFNIQEELQLSSDQTRLFSTLFTFHLLTDVAESVNIYTAGRDDQMADITREYRPQQSMEALREEAQKIVTEMEPHPNLSPAAFSSIAAEMAAFCKRLLRAENIEGGKDMVDTHAPEVLEVNSDMIEKVIPHIYAFLQEFTGTQYIGDYDEGIHHFAEEFATILQRYT